MKKHIILTIAYCLIFTFQSIAQHGDAQHGNARHEEIQRNQLKGPAAKNYKPWKEAISAKTILVKEHHQLMGPKAKNHKLWKDDCETSPLVFAGRSNLKGPNAKNQRHLLQSEDLADVAWKVQ